MAELDAICVEPLSVAKSVMIPSNICAPKVIGGKQHIYAYVDGEAKYVPIRSNNDVVNYLGTKVNTKYEDKLCAFAVDDNGYYYIRCLSNSYDEDGNYNGIEKNSKSVLRTTNSDAMFIAEDARIVADVQRVDESDDDYLYLSSRDNVRKAYVRDDTKVIVRTYFEDSDTYEWVTYDKDALLYMELSSDGLTNLGHNIPTESISYILSNKTNSIYDEYALVVFITNTYIGVNSPNIHKNGILFTIIKNSTSIIVKISKISFFEIVGNILQFFIDIAHS